MGMITQPDFTFDTGTASHVGCIRSLNEDRVLARLDLGMWVVADGMGGHSAGDLASSTLVAALESIGRAVSGSDLLAQFENRVIRANSELRKAAESGGVEIIGTTVAAILVHGQHYACVWSGDSRVYLWRDGALRQISRDHTEIQDLIDRGILAPDEAKTWPRRNVITRAIGVSEEAELEFKEGVLQNGDRFVLCSDGLTGHVADAEIAEIAAKGGAQAACDALIALTLERGATDNVSVIVVACLVTEPPAVEPTISNEQTVRAPGAGRRPDL